MLGIAAGMGLGLLAISGLAGKLYRVNTIRFVEYQSMMDPANMAHALNPWASGRSPYPPSASLPRW